MAAPTQVFPPWLTPVPTTIFGPGGRPVATTTTVIQLPLTYFGPSIPLGPGWVFGGSASVASIGLPGSTSTRSTATPNSSSSHATHTITSSSSTATHESTSSTTSFQTTPSTTFTTPATPTSNFPSTSPVTTTAISSTLSTPVSGSSIFPSNPSSSITGSGTSSAGGSSTSSSGGSGSSSPSGSTASSSASASSTSGLGASPSNSPTLAPAPTSSSSGASFSSHTNLLVGAIVGSVLGAVLLLLLLLVCLRWRSNRRRSEPAWVDAETYGRPRGGSLRDLREGTPRDSGDEIDPFLMRNSTYSAGGLADAHPHAQDDDASVGSNGSGYGTVINEGIALNEKDPSSDGHILPPAAVLAADATRRSHQHRDSQDSGVHLPLLEPPPPLDRFASRGSKTSSDVDPPESATLLTARRVHVNELGVRGSPTDENDESHPFSRSSTGSTGLAAAIGTGLARIGRMSWFKKQGSSSSPQMAQTSSGDVQNDPEAAVPLLSEPRTPVGARKRWGQQFGLLDDGTRPISGVSARSAQSGMTAYHDARSHMSGRSGAGTPRSNLARSHTPQHVESDLIEDPIPPPPTFSLHRDETQSQPQESQSAPAGADVLDSPPPVPASPFATMSTASGRTSNPYPPGLPDPRAWRDSRSGSSEDGAIRIELDDQPPQPQSNWRSLSMINETSGSERATFSMPRLVHPASPRVSEVPSVHSLTSHLSPHFLGEQSQGHAQHSSGSTSSRSHGHSNPSNGHSSHSSRSRGMASAHSLAHSGSFSSQGHNRQSTMPGRVSLGAFGLMHILPGEDDALPLQSAGMQHTSAFQLPDLQEPAATFAPPQSGTGAPHRAPSPPFHVELGPALRPVHKGTVISTATADTDSTAVESSFGGDNATLRFPAVPWADNNSEVTQASRTRRHPNDQDMTVDG